MSASKVSTVTFISLDLLEFLSGFLPILMAFVIVAFASRKTPLEDLKESRVDMDSIPHNSVSDEYLHSNSLEEKLVLTSPPDNEVASFCGPQTNSRRPRRRLT